jgi:glutamate synthase (ferredoxin)
VTLPPATEYGAGLVFLPRDPMQADKVRALLHSIVEDEGLHLLAWRDVPTDDSSLGATARSVRPTIKQVFIGHGDTAHVHAAFERKLYVVRKLFEKAVAALDIPENKFAYIPSLSSNTLIYKGMLSADQITAMFPDLTDAEVESALALVHQRFSTNTFPSWPLAHPYRYVAHNGEINTLRGNINWMRAREALCRSKALGEDLRKVLPVTREGLSDTATFDNVLEFLVMNGRSLPHAILMMIPEPWQNHESMSPERRAFYEFHSSLMEPWDGPASITFTDGAHRARDSQDLRPAGRVR